MSEHEMTGKRWRSYSHAHRYESKELLGALATTFYAADVDEMYLEYCYKSGAEIPVILVETALYSGNQCQKFKNNHALRWLARQTGRFMITVLYQHGREQLKPDVMNIVNYFVRVTEPFETQQVMLAPTKFYLFINYLRGIMKRNPGARALDNYTDFTSAGGEEINAKLNRFCRIY